MPAGVRCNAIHIYQKENIRGPCLSECAIVYLLPQGQAPLGIALALSPNAAPLDYKGNRWGWVIFWGERGPGPPRRLLARPPCT